MRPAPSVSASISPHNVSNGLTSPIGPQSMMDWFLIKDSGSSAFNEDPKGYYFLTEDYVKLKMMDFMVPKGAVKGFIEGK